MNENGKVRIAAMSDVHCGKNSAGTLQPIFARAAQQADVLLLCGDLTDYGLAEEAHVLARELSAAQSIPVVAVLGNHDFESGRPQEVCEVLAKAGVKVLDGTACEVQGVGFAGVKGFVGGFDQRILEPWGEESIKRLVKETVDEALKLESALARLRNRQRVVLLHYSPIRATIEGEPPEIFALMGCSRLEDPLNRHPVAAVFHGHAHHGRPAGRTRTGVPVYNVSLSLLRRSFPDRPPFHIEEIAVEPAADGAGAVPAR